MTREWSSVSELRHYVSPHLTTDTQDKIGGGAKAGQMVKNIGSIITAEWHRSVHLVGHLFSSGFKEWEWMNNTSVAAALVGRVKEIDQTVDTANQKQVDGIRAELKEIDGLLDTLKKENVVSFQQLEEASKVKIRANERFSSLQSRVEGLGEENLLNKEPKEIPSSSNTYIGAPAEKLLLLGRMPFEQFQEDLHSLIQLAKDKGYLDDENTRLEELEGEIERADPKLLQQLPGLVQQVFELIYMGLGNQGRLIKQEDGIDIQDQEILKALLRVSGGLQNLSVETADLPATKGRPKALPAIEGKQQDWLSGYIHSRESEQAVRKFAIEAEKYWLGAMGVTSHWGLGFMTNWFSRRRIDQLLAKDTSNMNLEERKAYCEETIQAVMRGLYLAGLTEQAEKDENGNNQYTISEKYPELRRAFLEAINASERLET